MWKKEISSLLTWQWIKDMWTIEVSLIRTSTTSPPTMAIPMTSFSVSHIDFLSFSGLWFTIHLFFYSKADYPFVMASQNDSSCGIFCSYPSIRNTHKYFIYKFWSSCWECLYLVTTTEIFLGQYVTNLLVWNIKCICIYFDVQHSLFISLIWFRIVVVVSSYADKKISNSTYIIQKRITDIFTSTEFSVCENYKSLTSLCRLK